MEPGPPKKRKVNNESYEQEVTSSVTSSSSSIQVVDLSVIPPSPQIPGTSKEAATPGQMDSKLRELLLSSPAHLFGHQPAAQPGGNNPQAAVTSWENWLCVLATNLSPAQWQGYWLAHCALFGEQAVPVHMLSFFQGQTSPSSSSSPSSTIQQGPHPNDAIQERYGTLFQILYIFGKQEKLNKNSMMMTTPDKVVLFLKRLFSYQLFNSLCLYFVYFYNHIH
ncbi:hypothetical protein CRE_14034 [Caenorhabditis remanei]|uniref:Uncharacterized protein n=1 Tax=Caenorhabditis remanei TaxID=31234 RepID=E3M8X3_CAERE|nr:hypothetical protein CRE_14034 [Caenorhabditis remanei]